MRIVIVVAATDTGVIGIRNALPWHLPDDLKRFKQLTWGKPVLMGRKTHESIGRPLPGRLNIVVSRRPDFIAPGCQVVTSIEAGLGAAASAAELCVIGGSEIFAALLPRADVVYLTRVHATIEGDVFLPALDERAWRITARELHPADAHHAYPFTFLTLERSS